jgi:glutathione synthase/RimK-type ligase-like ATP-grasp enzyme
VRWVDWDDLVLGIRGELWHQGKPVDPPVRALVRSRVFTRADDLSIVFDGLRILEAFGVQVINDADAIQRAHNKVLACAVLDEAGVRVPPTRLVRTVTEIGQCLLDWDDVVLKPVSGHSMVGLTRLLREPEDGSDTPPGVTVFQEVQVWHLLRHHRALCAQHYVDHPGPELRVLVVDEDIVACNRRTPVFAELNASRSHRGYRTEQTECTDEIADVARTAVRSLGLRYSAVDIVEAGAGLVVLEAKPSISLWCDLDRRHLHTTPRGLGARIADLVCGEAMQA